MATYKYLAPGLHTVGEVLFVSGVVAAFAFAGIPFTFITTSGQPDPFWLKALIITGSSGVGSMLLGYTLEYIGDSWAPALSDPPHAALRVSPYVGAGGGGVHGSF